MKNSTVRNGKSRSKISSVGVGQPNARRKMPIVTSIAMPASTPATMPTRRTARKDRIVVGSVVVFMLRFDCCFCWDRKVGPDSTAPRLFRFAMWPARVIEILHDIFREKDIQRPIDRHTHFLFGARQFAPVNTAPEKPCDKSGKIHAQDPRHTGTATDRCELSKRFEFEWFLRFAIDTRDDVMARTLPSRDACCAVGGQKSPVAGSGTSAQSPSAQRPSWPLDLEMRIHFDSTAFLGTRDKIQDWVW